MPPREQESASPGDLVSIDVNYLVNAIVIKDGNWGWPLDCVCQSIEYDSCAIVVALTTENYRAGHLWHASFVVTPLGIGWVGDDSFVKRFRDRLTFKIPEIV